MPFIDVPLGDAKEGKPVPEGEYNLRVSSYEAETSKKGNPMYHAVIVIEDGEYPNALPIHYYINDVLEDDEESARNMKLLDTRRFLETFDIPYEDNGYDDEDVPGSTGKCLVILAAAEGQYDERNELRLPRLKGE